MVPVVGGMFEQALGMNPQYVERRLAYLLAKYKTMQRENHEALERLG
jgi:hypothetical protein